MAHTQMFDDYPALTGEILLPPIVLKNTLAHPYPYLHPSMIDGCGNGLCSLLTPYNLPSGRVMHEIIFCRDFDHALLPPDGTVGYSGCEIECRRC